MSTAQWTRKGKADFVTQVDRRAEEIIGETLLGAFPDSLVMGEELSPIPTSRTPHPAPLVWIVDPLDGTTNYLHRFPQYAVSIAAQLDGELVVGLVHDVPRNVRFSAVDRGGAWMDGKRIEVSKNTDPSLALIGTGFPYNDMTLWPQYRGQLERVSAGSAGIRRPGSAALDLCDVACGRFEGFWEGRLAPWDVAAGALIIREAGGLISDFSGNPDVLTHTSVVAGNPAIYEWLMDTLKEPRTPHPAPRTV